MINNASAINLGKNLIAHERRKHIDMRLHYFRELVSEGKLKLGYLKMEDQVADFLTVVPQNSPSPFHFDLTFGLWFICIVIDVIRYSFTIEFV